MFVALHVHDALLAGNRLRSISSFKNEFRNRFEKEDLREAKECVWLENSHDLQSRSMSLS